MKGNSDPNRSSLVHLLPAIAIWMIAGFSCTQPAGEDHSTLVTEDSQFNLLFSPDSGGITGADGLFSIPLPDGRSVFLTGDCFLGNVIDKKRDFNTRMLNNSFVVIDKDRSETTALYQGTYSDPRSLIVPEQTDTLTHWYWPGHGFTDDSTLFVFALNMYNDPALALPAPGEGDEVDELQGNQWAFRVAGIDLLRFSLPGMQYIGFDPVECTYDLDIHLGNNVLSDGGYLYFFGTRNDPDGSHIYRARTAKGHHPYHTGWEFYDGEKWSGNPESAAPMKLDISVSEQFTIFRMGEKYVLLTQSKGTNDIYTYTSDLPYADFGNKTRIYHTPEPGADPSGNLSSYNALAHPQYIDGDKLLVSYCLNSARVRDVFEDVDKYRGRFIRIPLSMIDSSFAGYRPHFTVALAQMHVEGGNREVNLARAGQMIAEAAAHGADIVLLPEAMDLGWAHPSALTEAEAIPGGATSRMLIRHAREQNIHVCAGLVEKAGDRVYNAALLISPEGKVVMHHRKINILDIAQDYYAQGRDLHVAETEFGNVGLMICADAFARQRVITQTLCYMGADIILSPASWAMPAEQDQNRELATAIWHAHYSPVARDFHVFIAGCSNVGTLNDGPWKGFSAIGNSMVVGPDGNIVAGSVFGVDRDTIIYHDVRIVPRPVRGTDWMTFVED